MMLLQHQQLPSPTSPSLPVMQSMAWTCPAWPPTSCRKILWMCSRSRKMPT